MVRKHLDHHRKAGPAVSKTPADVFAETTAVFLDFDGPVTHLFIDGRNQAIADSMRAVLRDHGEPASDVAATTHDPLIVLRWAYANCTADTFRAVEQACIDGEVKAAGVSEPTPGSTIFIRACHAAGRPLVIVSNNAPEAIQAFLERFRLLDQVDAIVGRERGNPELMKPNRYLIDQALKFTQQVPTQVAFIGDSITDVEAGDLTGLRTIGFAKNPRRGNELSAAGVEAITETVAGLADDLLPIGHHT